MCLIIVGLIVYEFLGYPLRFDVNDVTATMIFGVVSLVSYLILLNRHGKA